MPPGFLGAIMPLIVQSYTDAPIGYYLVYKNDYVTPEGAGPHDRWLAQTFLTVGSYTITGVALKLFQFDAELPAKTLTISIKATSLNVPAGNDLAVGTINASNLTLNPAGEWREITFSSPYELSAATQYAIVIRSAAEDTSLAWTHSTKYLNEFASLVFNKNISFAWTAFHDVGFNFATLADAVDVEKLSPGHNSVVSTGATTIIDWEDPGSGATKYSWTLTYEHPISGESIISGTVNAPTTQKDISSPISSIYDTGARECTWKLRPFIGGEYVEDTDPWTLYIVGPPPVAINPTPADTASPVAMAPLLQWELDGPLGDDDYFFIYLNTDINTMSTVAGLQQGWIVTPKLQILSGLIANTTYYWQVHVANTQGWSESAIWSFTTRNFAPPVVSGGEDTPTGGNNMLTVRRLVVAARNRIYYEGI